MNDPDTVMSTYERERQARAKLSEANKQAVFDALAAANINQVHVEFDGEGDQGQIESVIALREEERAEFPNVGVIIRHVPSGEYDPIRTIEQIEKAIETLCYDYLEETHGGWENNDGAYGDFRLDVAKRTVELEFNGRFTDTCTSNHKF